MPPGQARMVDTWADYTGCWADVYDDDHEEMQACEANPDPGSALGLRYEKLGHLIRCRHGEMLVALFGVRMGIGELGGRAGQFLTVMLTPELYALPAELKASDTKVYEPLGTVVVFQAHNHP
jgi:hypothetical protein